MQSLEGFHKTRCDSLTEAGVYIWICNNIWTILSVLSQRVIDILAANNTKVSVASSPVIPATR
ncbi:hypothetical protein KLPMCP350B_24380 [Klebsiella pneumoniae]